MSIRARPVSMLRTLRVGSATVRLMAVALAVLMACVLVPIGMVLYMSVWSSPVGTEGHFTFAHFAYVLTDETALPLLRNTVIFTLGAAGAATLLGTLMAWIVTSTDVPFARVLKVLPLLPALLPGLTKDTAWIVLYSPRSGLVNIQLQRLFDIEGHVFDIYTMTGMIVSTALSLAIIPYLIMLVPFSAIGRAHEEASRISGAGRLQTLLRVVIPGVRPALISAMALSTLLVALAFETPVLIGEPGGIRTYMSAIFASIARASTPDYNLAAAQSLVYLLLSLVLLGWYLHATKSERRFAVVTGKGYAKGKPMAMGRWRWMLFAIVIVFFFFGFVQLFAITLLLSLVPFYTATAGWPFTNLTLEGYANLLDTPGVVDSFTTSLWLGATVGPLTVLAATGLSLIALKTRWRFRRLAELGGILPAAMPGLVFSVALLLTVLFVPGLVVLYNSVIPMVIAQVVIFLPYAMRIISSALVQLHDELLEVSRVCGTSWFGSARRIAVPLLVPALIGATVLVFVYSFRELGAVVLLVAPDMSLFPVLIFELWEAGMATQVAVLNMIAATIPAVLVGLCTLGLRALNARLRTGGVQSATPTPPTGHFAFEGDGDRPVPDPVPVDHASRR